MSKGRKRRTQTGTDKQTLAAVEMPVAMHDAALPAAEGATPDMSKTTTSGESGSHERQAEAGIDATADMATAAGNAAPEERALEPAEATTPDDLFEAAAATTPAAAAPRAATAEMRLDVAAGAPHGSIGQRFRGSREARNWSVEDVSTRLHIPVPIIRALETEQFDRIDHGVYLRGYLMSYARLLDVPTILVENVARERGQTPPLVASGTISHSRYLYQRYSVSALYLILTGVIIVPAVLLAMRAGLQPAVTQLTPLDAPPLSAPADAAPTGGPADQNAVAAAAGGGTGAETPTAPAAQETPLVASLAPFSALSHKDAAHADAGTTAPATSATPQHGAHTLKLTLKEASWVEIVAAGGEKLEYGLLPAGTTRTYTSEKTLEVRLGNSSGAEVETDGVAQDLAAYRRSNVARFKLFAPGEAISRADQ